MGVISAGVLAGAAAATSVGVASLVGAGLSGDFDGVGAGCAVTVGANGTTVGVEAEAAGIDGVGIVVVAVATRGRVDCTAPLLVQATIETIAPTKTNKTPSLIAIRQAHS